MIDEGVKPEDILTFFPRWRELGAEATYDKENDILEFHVGPACETIVDHVFDSLYVVRNAETGELIGFTIKSFASRLLANNELARLTFGPAFEKLRTTGVLTYPPEKLQR